MADNNVISELMVQLHRYHRQLAELQHRFKKGEQLTALKEEKLVTLQAALGEKKKELLHLLAKVKELELELSNNDAAIAKRKSQLSEAKNNKEYQSLKLQIESDEASNGELSEKVLVAIEEAEQFEQGVNVTRQETEQFEEQLRLFRQETEQERPSILADIQTYRQRLGESEKSLPGGFAEAYNLLVRKLGGEAALAPVVNNTFCGNCNQQIPIHFVTLVCDGNPFTCQACGRLLYIPEQFVLR